MAGIGGSGMCNSSNGGDSCGSSRLGDVLFLLFCCCLFVVVFIVGVDSVVPKYLPHKYCQAFHIAS